MSINICVAIKNTGERCNKLSTSETTHRCKEHNKVLYNNGPNLTEEKELKYLQKKAMNDFEIECEIKIESEKDTTKQNELIKLREIEKQSLIEKHRFELNELKRKHRAKFVETGIDPDRDAAERRVIKNRERREARREMEIMNQHRAGIGGILVDEDELDILANVDDIQAVILAALGPLGNQYRPANRGELERFASDNQNVHRESTVKQTKEYVEKILAIPVPTEYKWNMNECSKTPADIINFCKLTPKATWQMSSKYCNDEDIYELGPGVYGKVLDGVWQFILKSPDKDDLCRILKQEMEDNIGMCAQGNLSRLCNILSGYMEGIGSNESTAEVLGRELSVLSNVPDVSKRFEVALVLFKRLNVPTDQYESWLDPLVDDSVKDIQFSKPNGTLKEISIKFKEGIQPISAKFTIN